MANVKYCPLCQRNVEPTKKINWPVFIILLIIGIIPGILYFLYYLLKPKNVCPICGTKRLQNVDKAADQALLQEQNPS